MREVISLGDKQVAQITKRGTSVVLSLMQEESTDFEIGVTYPAKSFTVVDLEGLKNLRDLFNNLIPIEDGEI